MFMHHVTLAQSLLRMGDLEDHLWDYSIHGETIRRNAPTLPWAWDVHRDALVWMLVRYC